MLANVLMWRHYGVVSNGCKSFGLQSCMSDAMRVGSMRRREAKTPHVVVSCLLCFKATELGYSAHGSAGVMRP